MGSSVPYFPSVPVDKLASIEITLELKESTGSMQVGIYFFSLVLFLRFIVRTAGE